MIQLTVRMFPLATSLKIAIADLCCPFAVVAVVDVIDRPIGAPDAAYIVAVDGRGVEAPRPARFVEFVADILGSQQTVSLPSGIWRCGPTSEMLSPDPPGQPQLEVGKLRRASAWAGIDVLMWNETARVEVRRVRPVDNLILSRHVEVRLRLGLGT